MAGDIDMNSNKIKNLRTPVAANPSVEMIQRQCHIIGLMIPFKKLWVG
jgi:hypothetical protein